MLKLSPVTRLSLHDLISRMSIVTMTSKSYRKIKGGLFREHLGEGQFLGKGVADVLVVT